MTDLVEGLSLAEEALGEPLLVLGSGPVPVDRARSGILALGGDGTTVLVVTLDSVTPQSAIDIADHLDRLSRYSEQDLAALRTIAPIDEDLRAQHAAFFESAPLPLNRRRKAILVVDREPSVDVWKAVFVELGSQLAGVYRVEGQTPVPLSAPQELKRSRGDLFPPSAIALAIALIVGGFIVYSAQNAVGPETASGPSLIRTVVAGTQGAATHPQWIGQQRLLRTSQGELLALVTTDDDLQIVSDARNQGRSWLAPMKARGIEAVSLSAAIDDEDRIHVAYSDGRSIRYSILRRGERGWEHGPILTVDRGTTSPVVDLAWDAELEIAHLVWANNEGGQHQPLWAAISSSNDKPRIVQTASLAPAGEDSTVLVNVAAASGQEVTATYRKGNPVYGWFSRTAVPVAGGGFEFQEEQKVPTDQFIGAADVSVDPSGTTHLILRDSVQMQLVYSQRPLGGKWSPLEVAVDEETIEQIDFPVLSVDDQSQLVHLFFQSNRVVEANEIRATVRDPAAGWLEDFPLASGEELINGAAFPSTMRLTSGAPLVMWTTTLGSPAIQFANVVAP